MISEAELGTKEDEIDKWRRYFEGMTEDKLINEMRNHIKSSPRYIAAEQRLLSINEAKTIQRHNETLRESTRANKLSRIAVGISALALVVAVLALIYQ